LSSGLESYLLSVSTHLESTDNKHELLSNLSKSPYVYPETTFKTYHYQISKRPLPYSFINLPLIQPHQHLQQLIQLNSLQHPNLLPSEYLFKSGEETDDLLEEEGVDVGGAVVEAVGALEQGLFGELFGFQGGGLTCNGFFFGDGWWCLGFCRF
jgi:hypothetical protein